MIRKRDHQAAEYKNIRLLCALMGPYGWKKVILLFALMGPYGLKKVILGALPMLKPIDL